MRSTRRSNSTFVGAPWRSWSWSACRPSVAKASRPSTRSSASRPNSRTASRCRMFSPSRTPAASASSSSERAISLDATPVSRERILSSSLSRSLTSAASLVRPGRLRVALRASSSGASGSALASAAISRAPMSLLRHPADSPRTLPRSSWVLGGWPASSASVSSLTIRPRGRFLPRASVSRQPARAFSRPSTCGLRLGQLEALPRILGREGEARRVGEPLHLLVEPAAAAGLAQLVDHLREDRREVGDVGDGIVDLALVERAAAPVGEARALVEHVAEHRFDQVRIADLLAIAQAPSPRSGCRTTAPGSCRSGYGRSPGPARRRGRP